MNTLIKYSIKHPISVFMCYILLIVAGIICLFITPMDFLPEIKDHTLIVSTFYPGIACEQMKDLITTKVENSFSSLQGIKKISSVTRDSCSFVKVLLHDSTNINSALLDSRQIIDQLYQTLPQDCLKPEVDIFSSSSNSTMKIMIYSKSKDLSYLRETAENELKTFFQTVPGIGEITITGGNTKEIHILYDTQKLYALNLTPQDISNSIINTNFEYPAGVIKDKDNEYILKTSGLFHSLNDIEKVKIITSESSITLNEIAKVQYGNSTKRTFALYDNNEGIFLDIQKKSSANPLLTSKKIKEAIKEFSQIYPSIDFQIVEDSSIEIRKSIYSVLLTAIISSVITFFVIFFFFKNKKISLILSIPIPLCILFSIVCLKIFGKSINLFSLSGISISIGMLVDASIVVIENIISNAKSSINTDDKIYSAIQNVKTSTINSSLTTIIVFTPFFLFPGNFGELFSDLALAVIASIFLSGLISFTLIPSCYKFFLSKDNTANVSIPFLSSIEKKYHGFLNNYLPDSKKRNKLLIFLFLSIISAIPFILLIKKEFSRNTNTNELLFTIDFPANQNITKTEKEIKQLISSIKNHFPNMEIYALGGIDSEDYSKMANELFNSNTVFLSLNNTKKINLTTITDILNSHNLRYQQLPSQDYISQALNLDSKYIFTYETENELNNFIQTYPETSPNYKTNEIVFQPDFQKLAFFQIPKSYISNYLYYLYEGINCGDFKTKNSDIPIIAKPKNNSADFQNSLLKINDTPVSILSLGSLAISEKEKTLYRYNKSDAKVITQVYNNNNFNLISTFSEKIKEVLSSSLFLLVLVILLLYCLLGAQLESFYKPVILLLSILPGFTGSLFFLFVTNNSLNINSLLSLIILSGISINNSIILLESVSVNTKTFSSFSRTLISRVKPILITTLTSIFSLIPFIFIPNESSQSSMSIALCGGLCFAVVSSLIFIPVFLYKSKDTK